MYNYVLFFFQKGSLNYMDFRPQKLFKKEP